MADVYSILGVADTASLADIKSAYQAAALRLHPDKNPSPDAATSFTALQAAYDLVRDESRKAEYDAQMEQDRMERRRMHVHVNEEVNVADMETCTVQDGLPGLSYPCRCGGRYSMVVPHGRGAEGGAEEGNGSMAQARGVPREAMENAILTCDGCSLRIRVLCDPL